jgi:hypothetical protein
MTTDRERAAHRRQPTERFGAALAALALLLLPGGARANAAAPYSLRPEHAAGAFALVPTPASVDREDLVIRCAEHEVAPRCSFVATYALSNDTPDRVEVEGAFVGVEPDGVTVTLDGKDVRQSLRPEAERAVDEATRKFAPPQLREGDAPPTFVRQGFAFALEPGARATLVFRGDLAPVYADNPRRYTGFVIPPHETRHPLFGTELRREARWDFRYLLWPLRTWAGARTVHVEVRHPAGWNAAPSPLLPREMRDGSDLVRTGTCDGATAEALDLRFSFAPFPLLHGGPLIGVGGRLDLGELRLRAGWEAAGPSWLIYGLAVETDARQRFSTALTVDAATPNILLFFPSFAFGAGPIFQVRPGSAAFGPRLQATVSFPLLSLVVPLDLFPGQPDPWQIAMMVQASL